MNVILKILLIETILKFSSSSIPFDSAENVKVTRLTSDCPVEIEGPFWDQETQVLYFVDTYGNAVHKFDSRTNKHTFAYLDRGSSNRNVSTIFPIKNKKNNFVVTFDRFLYSFYWDGESKNVWNYTRIFTIEDRPDYQCNDAKVSPSGVFFVGTAQAPFDLSNTTEQDGYLVTVHDNRRKNILRGIPFSNGLTWSKDESRFYFANSLFAGISGFDYNPKTITISNQRTVFDFKKYNISGIPDGQTTDMDDNLWIATSNGTTVLQVNSKTGELLQKIIIEKVFAVSSVIFGGPCLEDIFVTTSSRGRPKEQTEAFPYGGCLYRISNVNAKGSPSMPIDRNILSL